MLDHLSIKDERTLRKRLNELKIRGWIEIIRQGKMKPNKYILYGIKKSDWNAMVNMHKVQLKLQRDFDLIQRLNNKLTSNHA